MFCVCACYIFCAAAENWIVNLLKNLGVSLPILFCIIQNSTWPVLLVQYHFERSLLPEKRELNPSMLRNYMILGSLASIISLSRMFGIITLSPIVYVVCTNTEIVFETIMTRLLLNRRVTFLQGVAVLIVLFAVVVAVYDPETNQFGSGGNNDSSSMSSTTSESSSISSKSDNTFIFGVTVSILSRFLSSLNTILAEKFLGKDARSKVAVTECAIANSLVPFLTVPLTLLLIPEYRKWSRELWWVRSQGYVEALKHNVLVVVYCLLLAVSKQVDRVAKFGIVHASSTIFFAGIDSFMKMLAGFGSLLLFPSQGGGIAWPEIVAFFMVCASVLLLYVDKKVRLQAATLALALTSSSLGSVEDIARGGVSVLDEGVWSNHDHSKVVVDKNINNISNNNNNSDRDDNEDWPSEGGCYFPVRGDDADEPSASTFFSSSVEGVDVELVGKVGLTGPAILYKDDDNDTNSNRPPPSSSSSSSSS